MGGSLSFGDKKVDPCWKFVVLGLPRTGKTSLVHRLKHGKVLENPYHSSDIETEELEQIQGIKLYAWDYGGRGAHRIYTRIACVEATGIIYMIDSSDTESLEESLDFLNFFLQDEVCSKQTIMIVANKQDLDDALSPEEIEKEMKQQCKIRKNKTLFVMPMSATAEDDHSVQLAYRLFFKMMKRKKNRKYQTGLIPRAWETAEKVAQDSDIDEEDDDTKDKDGAIKEKGTQGDKKKKSLFKNPIHTFKSILTH